MHGALKRNANCCESGHRSDRRAYSRAVRRGGMSALNQWLLENESIVYNLAYRILGEPDSAAAATERTFLKACRQRPRGQPSVRWLFRIAVAMCQEELRQAPLPSPDTRAPLVGGNAHESATAHTSHQLPGDGVQALLNTLTPDQRVTLVLSDVQGLSYREIAAITGLSGKVIRSRLSQGRIALRNALLAEGEFPPGAQP